MLHRKYRTTHEGGAMLETTERTVDDLTGYEVWALHQLPLDFSQKEIIQTAWITYPNRNILLPKTSPQRRWAKTISYAIIMIVWILKSCSMGELIVWKTISFNSLVFALVYLLLLLNVIKGLNFLLRTFVSQSGPDHPIWWAVTNREWVSLLIPSRLWMVKHLLWAIMSALLFYKGVIVLSALLICAIAIESALRYHFKASIKAIVENVTSYIST